MAAKKDIEKAVKFKEFQRTVEKFLTPVDKDYLFYALKEYNTYKSVGKLMLALNSCLDTPEKLDLLPYIRDLIPKHDRKRFDNLAPYNRMAHPLHPEPPPGLKRAADGADLSTKKRTRVINLQRAKGMALGFSIRGGQEHELGIYISHVESFSQAEKAGLQVGDKLIRVNGIDFERVSHSSAVLVLKSHDNLKIEVKSTGKVPGQTPKLSFIWVDARGKPVEEVDADQKRTSHASVEDERSPDRLLSASDRHKIVLHSSKKRSLGFSIRGGNEYGLGIYISMVDPGSPSEEAGLRVGDQILDINGHSFLSILHFEAVHILKSYATLIMTIKSLGRIPVLQEENAGEEIAKSKGGENAKSEVPLEQSPITRRRSAESARFGSPRARSSKRPSSATIREEEEPEPEEGSDTHIISNASSLKRSASERRSNSLPGSQESVGHTDQSKATRSNSFGIVSPFSQRVQFKKKQMVTSPLATHETRASTSSPSPIPSPDNSPIKVKPKFFEKGVGTQVMLANMSSQAKQLLFDKARRVLSEEDVEILKEDLLQYEDSGDVDQFVDCLISIFNAPEKMELLRDVRSVIKPTDIGRFDEKISPHELRALQEKMSESDTESDFEVNMDTEDGIVLTGVHHQNGHVRRFSGEREKSSSLRFEDIDTPMPDTPGAGFFVSNTSMSAPDLSRSGPQRDVAQYWYESGEDKTPLSASQNGTSRAQNHNYNVMSQSPHLRRSLMTRPQGNPVVIDVDKEAPYIGLAIKTTQDNCVLVKDVRPGGAIDRNGFIQPGFEIVQVDNIRVRGKSYHDAAREIADAFKSKGPTVQFRVVPNYA